MNIEIKTEVEEEEKKDDLSRQLQRYTDHFSVEAAKKTFFDVEDFFNKLETHLTGNKDINMCFRNNKCYCKSDICICDDDIYTGVRSVSLQLCSNCKYLVDIEFAKKFKMNKKTLRFFELKNYIESPIFDIMVDNRIGIFDKGKETFFSIEDKLFRDNKYLSFFIDYMSFSD